MKFFVILTVLTVACCLTNEISAARRRGYVYKKQNNFLADFIEGGDTVDKTDYDFHSSNNTEFGLLRQPFFNRKENCMCGVPNQNRIVGGTVVRYNKYPWIVQLLQGRFLQFFCGGALINTRYVATAAHCTSGQSAHNLRVRLLQYDRSKSTDGITKHVTQIINHPNYNPTTIDNDIALLKLYDPVALDTTIRPICLPLTRDSYAHAIGIAAGWGLTKEGGSVSNILQEVSVPIITNQECRGTRYKNMITDNMLCAGNVAVGGKDACQGDSGGPLIAASGYSYKLVGVVSYGYGCAQKNAPGVYARVSQYLSWIAENTRDSRYCLH